MPNRMFLRQIVKWRKIIRFLSVVLNYGYSIAKFLRQIVKNDVKSSRMFKNVKSLVFDIFTYKSKFSFWNSVNIWVFDSFGVYTGHANVKVFFFIFV